VFWNRSAREARRQTVLDELIDLDPERRRRRLELAVAEGDIRPAEVEQALKLVSRLDALRVMTVPGARDGTRTAPDAADLEVVGSIDAPASLRQRVELQPDAILRGPAGRRETSKKRDRRSARVAAEPMDLPILVAAASDSGATEQRPDISWLRP